MNRIVARLCRGAIPALVLLVAACAAPRANLKPDAALLARQAAREQTLAGRNDWSLEGRLGVSDGRDGGSGSLEWTEHGERYRFSVHAPVTGKTWTLTGDPAHAVLEGLADRAIEGRDAASLLEREVGWRVPVAALTYWVRGARAPGNARIEFRADGLPALIEQDGWTVEYLDYDTTPTPALPVRIFARRGPDKVRLAIGRWSVE